MNTPVDFWFITNVLDPITQRFQKFTGLDCFWLAKIPLWLSLIIFFSVYLPVTLLTLGLFQWTTSFLLVIVLALMVIFVINKHSHDLLCRHCGGINGLRYMVYEQVHSGNKNPLALYKTRRFLLPSIIFISFEVMNLVQGMYITFVGYALTMAPVFLDYVSESFQACTPLPPSKSTLRKWFDGVTSLIQNVLTPNQEPIPA